LNAQTGEIGNSGQNIDKGTSKRSYFRSFPTMPILVGGALVIAGGAIISLWKPA
jgi:hypothetical protein